jgi:hypothetical protein
MRRRELEIKLNKLGGGGGCSEMTKITHPDKETDLPLPYLTSWIWHERREVRGFRRVVLFSFAEIIIILFVFRRRCVK